MDIGTRSPSSEPAFHADDTEQVADYRTVSAFAVVSLLFGLASPLCIAWPLFLAIPLFGAAISIVAILRIDASDGALAGRWMAIAGLALCVISGAAVVSHDVTMRTIRTRQAQAFAREWIELLLAGDTETAFRLTVAGNRSEPPSIRPGMTRPPDDPYDLFVKTPFVAGLATAGRGAEIQYIETMNYEPQAGHQFFIQQKFFVSRRDGASGAHPEPIELTLTLQRSKLSRERQPRWLVAAYDSPPTATAAP